MDKKGQTFFWIIRLLVLVGIFAVIHLVVSNSLRGEINTYGLEYDILMAKIVNAVMYEDSTHIVDLSKFSNRTLQQAVKDAHGAVIKATLTSEIRNVSIYNNGQLYGVYFPLLGFGDVPEHELLPYQYLTAKEISEREFSFGRVEYKFVPKSFIVHVYDGVVYKQPARLQVNMIFPVKEVVYR